jgi:hypothetical protein
LGPRSKVGVDGRWCRARGRMIQGINEGGGSVGLWRGFRVFQESGSGSGLYGYDSHEPVVSFTCSIYILLPLLVAPPPWPVSHTSLVGQGISGPRCIAASSSKYQPHLIYSTVPVRNRGTTPHIVLGPSSSAAFGISGKQSVLATRCYYRDIKRPRPL